MKKVNAKFLKLSLQIFKSNQSVAYIYVLAARIMGCFKIMGHISIVYGHIIGEAWKSEDYHKLHRLNKRVIEGLPDNDEIFPWITRKMFLVPDPDTDKMYRDQVIVFAASYKSVEHEWSEWLDKFETILKQLYWSRTTIHLDTELVGAHKYEWIFDTNQSDNWMSDSPQPTTMWEFKGGPRKFFDNYKRIEINE